MGKAKASKINQNDVLHFSAMLKKIMRLKAQYCLKVEIFARERGKNYPNITRKGMIIWISSELLLVYMQGSNWGGMRGDGIPLVEKNDKKHPLCKTTIPLGLFILCVT